jgi:hypothetical protein
MRRIMHAVLFVLAFLFAQGGMVAHAISHVAPTSHAGDKGVAQDAACDLCVGYAHLSGSAPLPANALLPVSLARQDVPSQHAPVLVTLHAFHSHARAPPAFS